MAPSPRITGASSSNQLQSSPSKQSQSQTKSKSAISTRSNNPFTVEIPDNNKNTNSSNSKRKLNQVSSTSSSDTRKSPKRIASTSASRNLKESIEEEEEEDEDADEEEDDSGKSDDEVEKVLASPRRSTNALQDEEDEEEEEEEDDAVIANPKVTNKQKQQLKQKQQQSNKQQIDSRTNSASNKQSNNKKRKSMPVESSPSEPEEEDEEEQDQLDSGAESDEEYEEPPQKKKIVPQPPYLPPQKDHDKELKVTEKNKLFVNSRGVSERFWVFPDFHDNEREELLIKLEKGGGEVVKSFKKANYALFPRGDVEDFRESIERSKLRGCDPILAFYALDNLNGFDSWMNLDSAGKKRHPAYKKRIPSLYLMKLLKPSQLKKKKPAEPFTNKDLQILAQAKCQQEFEKSHTKIAMYEYLGEKYPHHTKASWENFCKKNPAALIPFEDAYLKKRNWVRTKDQHKIIIDDTDSEEEEEDYETPAIVESSGDTISYPESSYLKECAKKYSRRLAEVIAYFQQCSEDKLLHTKLMPLLVKPQNELTDIERSSLKQLFSEAEDEVIGRYDNDEDVMFKMEKSKEQIEKRRAFLAL